MWFCNAEVSSFSSVAYGRNDSQYPMAETVKLLDLETIVFITIHEKKYLITKYQFATSICKTSCFYVLGSNGCVWSYMNNKFNITAILQNTKNTE